MPPSKGDSVLLENGTVKVDKVALKDLAFWLPKTKEHLRDGITSVSTFKSLVELPIAHYSRRLTLYMHIFLNVFDYGTTILTTYDVGDNL